MARRLLPQRPQQDQAANGKLRGQNTLLPFVLGGCLTAVFYAALPHLPWYGELANRYFCSHPLAYATTTLFFSAIAALSVKLWQTIPERRALTRIKIDADELSQLEDDNARAQHLLHGLSMLEVRLRCSLMARRVSEVADYIRGRRSSRGLPEHLKYLGELTADRLHQSYAVVRTITWAVPILGFLGTVIGITMAIANVTPEQLETSLGSVTSGLAVAFDTTALALALSIVLVFLTFGVERSEQKISAAVEQFGIRALLPAFPGEQERASRGLDDLQHQAANRLIEATESLVNQQAEMWSEHMHSMRERWSKTLDAQQSALNSALSGEVAQTLEAHRTQLDQQREAVLQQVAQLSQTMHDQFEKMQHSQQQQMQQGFREMEAFWERLQSETESVAQWQSESRRELVQSINAAGEQWQQALGATAEASQAQTQQLNQLAEALSRLIDQNGQLAQSEHLLNENLAAVRAASSFDETLHNLNAAVHLLTARVQPRAA